MMKSSLAMFVGLCLLSACSAPPDAPAEAAKGGGEAAQTGVRLDAEAQTRTGVQVASIEHISAPVSAEGFARVMDVGPLASVDAEVSAAASAAAASQAEYRRLVALAAADQAASVRAVEAARAQAGADGARAALASRRIGLEWGPGLARLSSQQRSRLLADVSAGRAALVRVDVAGVAGNAQRVLLQPDETSARIGATVLGPAGAADPRLQTAGIMAVVRGADAAKLPAGRLIRAQVETGAVESGFLVPRAAIVRVESSTWVYVRIAADRFERRELRDARVIDRGWFAKSGFVDSDVIVVAGAASLLAAERGPVEVE